MDKTIDFESIFGNACNMIAKKHGLGIMLVTGHKAAYWNEAAKQSIRQALPIILQIAADRATAYDDVDDAQSKVDKQSILNSEEEIIKQLGI